MPSEKILKEKQAVVAELAGKIKNAQAGVFVDYRGITVAEDVILRSKMREAGVEYSVIKNTLTKLAAKDADLAVPEEILEGTTSLAMSDSDLTSPAKIISEFAKTHPSIKVKAGFVEGEMVSADAVKDLANLPSRDVLYAQLLGGMNAPISGLVNVMSGLMRSFVIVLNAVAEKESA